MMLRKFLIFGLLAGTTIALIAFSPTIYAIVEPHITITMDPGQTTKPFAINDDQSTEVFSINPDGSFSAGNIVVLHFEQKGIITIPQETLSDDPLLLAVWQVVKDPGVSDNLIYFTDAAVTAQLKRVSGPSTGVAFGFYHSEDGIDWDDRVRAVTSSTVFSPRAGALEQVFVDDSFFAFGVHTNRIDTAGEAKDVSGAVTMTLPAGYSLERIL